MRESVAQLLTVLVVGVELETLFRLRQRSLFFAAVEIEPSKA